MPLRCLAATLSVQSVPFGAFLPAPSQRLGQARRADAKGASLSLCCLSAARLRRSLCSPSAVFMLFGRPICIPLFYKRLIVNEGLLLAALKVTYLFRRSHQPLISRTLTPLLRAFPRSCCYSLSNHFFVRLPLAQNGSFYRLRKPPLRLLNVATRACLRLQIFPSPQQGFLRGYCIVAQLPEAYRKVTSRRS